MCRHGACLILVSVVSVAALAVTLYALALSTAAHNQTKEIVHGLEVDADRHENVFLAVLAIAGGLCFILLTSSRFTATREQIRTQAQAQAAPVQAPDEFKKEHFEEHLPPLPVSVPGWPFLKKALARAQIRICEAQGDGPSRKPVDATLDTARRCLGLDMLACGSTIRMSLKNQSARFRCRSNFLLHCRTARTVSGDSSFFVVIDSQTTGTVMFVNPHTHYASQKNRDMEGAFDWFILTNLMQGVEDLCAASRCRVVARVLMAQLGNAEGYLRQMRKLVFVHEPPHKNQTLTLTVGMSSLYDEPILPALEATDGNEYNANSCGFVTPQAPVVNLLSDIHPTVSDMQSHLIANGIYTSFLPPAERKGAGRQGAERKGAERKGAESNGEERKGPGPAAQTTADLGARNYPGPEAVPTGSAGEGGQRKGEEKRRDGDAERRAAKKADQRRRQHERKQERKQAMPKPEEKNGAKESAEKKQAPTASAILRVGPPLVVGSGPVCSEWIPPAVEKPKSASASASASSSSSSSIPATAPSSAAPDGIEMRVQASLEAAAASSTSASSTTEAAGPAGGLTAPHVIDWPRQLLHLPLLLRASLQQPAST